MCVRTLLFVVCRNRKFYKVQVLSSDGQLLPPIGIKKQLEKVFEMAGGLWISLSALNFGLCLTR